MVLSPYTSRKLVLSDEMTIRREQLESNKLQKRLRRNVGKAVADYRMIEEGSFADHGAKPLYFAQISFE